MVEAEIPRIEQTPVQIEDVIVGCILVADVEEKLLLVSLFEALPDDEDNQSGLEEMNPQGQKSLHHQPHHHQSGLRHPIPMNP